MNNQQSKPSTPAQARTLAAIKRRLASIDHKMDKPEHTTWREILENEGISQDVTLFELTAAQADLLIKSGNEAISFVLKLYAT